MTPESYQREGPTKEPQHHLSISRNQGKDPPKQLISILVMPEPNAGRSAQERPQELAHNGHSGYELSTFSRQKIRMFLHTTNESLKQL